MKTHAIAWACLFMPLTAHAAPTDPWSHAPALPTACYSGQDKFAEQAATQTGKIQAEIDRQSAINSGISERLEAIDDGQKQTLIMEYMMSHPDEAQQAMAALQSQGATGTEARLAANNENLRQQKSLEDLTTRYDAALKAAMAPYQAKLATLPFCESECSTPQWAIDEARNLYKQMDQEYAKLCGQWWQAGSPMHTWFAGYRKLLAGLIPHEEAAAASTRATNAMFGVTGDFRSVAPLRDVQEYIRRAGMIFGKRQAEPEFGRAGH